MGGEVGKFLKKGTAIRNFIFVQEKFIQKKVLFKELKGAPLG
jgi:hypothetical protein